MPLQFGGPIGPFQDNVQQRRVPVKVFGACEYRTSGPVADQAALENHVRVQVLQTINQVIGRKMASGELQFRNLHEGSLGSSLGEIMAAASAALAPSGVQIGGSLTMQFQIDNAPMAQPPQQQQQQPPMQQQQAPQQHIDARIHVMGLNINASSDKGIDTAGLQNQLKDKAKSEIMWWGIGCGVLLVVGLGLAGLGFYIWHAATTDTVGSARSAAAAKWDGKSPFTCGGSDNVKIEGVTAKLSDTAVTALGSCQLTLVNVNLDAPNAIEAGGNAVVTVQGGTINGTTLAIHAAANAQVHITGAKVTGKTQAQANGKITGL